MRITIETVNPLEITQLLLLFKSLNISHIDIEETTEKKAFLKLINRLMVESCLGFGKINPKIWKTLGTRHGKEIGSYEKSDV